MSNTTQIDGDYNSLSRRVNRMKNRLFKPVLAAQELRKELYKVKGIMVSKQLEKTQLKTHQRITKAHFEGEGSNRKTDSYHKYFRSVKRLIDSGYPFSELPPPIAVEFIEKILRDRADNSLNSFSEMCRLSNDFEVESFEGIRRLYADRWHSLPIWGGSAISSQSKLLLMPLVHQRNVGIKVNDFENLGSILYLRHLGYKGYLYIEASPLMKWFLTDLPSKVRLFNNLFTQSQINTILANGGSSREEIFAATVQLKMSEEQKTNAVYLFNKFRTQLAHHQLGLIPRNVPTITQSGLHVHDIDVSI